MILITGAAGFIGSALLWKLNAKSIDNIIVVDKFCRGDKWKNLRKRKFYDLINRHELFGWLKSNAKKVDIIVHVGACTDTTEENAEFLISNNYEYSKRLWNICVQVGIRFLYASSAATYGAGELGYKDDIELISELKPLNPYGWSKQLFDKWLLKQDNEPLQWVGFKFFNVYGPNEYHKGQMASVILHAFEQVKQEGKVRLFKSYKEEYNHGEQKRDFIYVKDVVDVISFFITNGNISGIYNVGTGKGRTFNDLVRAVFDSLGKEVKIEYVDMPSHLRKQYQYFTEANIDKLRSAGYKEDFHTLQKGIRDYVQNYLNTEDPYL